MKYFLLVYSRSAERVIEQFEFETSEREQALAKRRALQDAHREDEATEVVLLGAERYEDLRKTHSRYFGQLQKDLPEAVRG